MSFAFREKLVLLHMLPFLLIVGSVSAQEEDVLQRYEIKEQRLLGGHYFTPTSDIRIPFIVTHVRTSLGIGGVQDLRFPVLDVGDQEYLYLQGDIFAAILVFEYQHAVKDRLYS